MATLLVGFKSADVEAAIRRGEFSAGDVTCHELDIYHQHAIEKTFHGTVGAVCSAHLPQVSPDGSPWDSVRMLTGPKLMSGELSLDLIQECARLTGGILRAPQFRLDFIGSERDRNDLVGKVKDRIDRVFRAEWPASVPGGGKLMFTSYPGCFCHRRLDEGGLALAEVVSRELCERDVGASGLRLLDMGCGCGLVGLLIADRFRSIVPVLVDSHSRAVEAAVENAAKFGIEAEVMLSDNGTPAHMDATFDIFVGNPPYYSDYRIAEVFLETAVRALKPGGVCYQVVKNAAGLKPVQERYFPSVEVIARRGYSVLRSVKPE